MPEPLRGVVGALLRQTLQLQLTLTLLARIALLEPLVEPLLLTRRIDRLMIG
jgi:hypothetical protein